MDGHTRPGNLATRVLFSRLNRVIPAKYDKNMMFYYEGGLRNNKMATFESFKDHFIRQYVGWDPSNPAIQPWFDKYVKDQIHEVRSWVVNSKMKDEFIWFRERFDEFKEN
jgi:hypothetical protein